MNYKENFAERLVLLRESAGITQQQLADELGITRQSLSLYEKAERTINIDLLAKISDYFNVPTDYLMGRTEAKSLIGDIANACNVTGLSEEAVKKLNKYSKDERKNLNRLITSYKFLDALNVLEKYCELEKIERKNREKSYKINSNGNIILESPDLDAELTEEEKAKLDAQILLEDYGYIVLESDYEILDFYKQRFTSLIADVVDTIAQKDYEDMIRRP